MNKVRKIILSILGGIYLELMLFLLSFYCNEFIISNLAYKIGYSYGDKSYVLLILYIIILFIPFIIGFIVSYILSNKELNALDKYHNNFILTIIRIILAIIFSLLFFDTSIITKILSLFLILSILPITYRIINNKFKILVPKWGKIVLPIILFIVVVFSL